MRIIAWAFYLKFATDIDFSQIKSSIESDFNNFIKMIIDIANPKFLEFSERILDTAFFVSNIYYYRSGMELVGDNSIIEPLNKILEEINNATIERYPFLNTKNLEKLPDITAEEVGIVDLTKAKER